MNSVLALTILFAVATAMPQGSQDQDRMGRALLGIIREDPETKMTTDGMIRRWDYTAEPYNVTTGDGYILSIFRIPRPRNTTENPPSPRPVILIQHGLLGSSDMWVNNLPIQDLPFLAADAKFDVWIGNFRGNKYGKRHVTLNPKDDKKAFWDFSWPEMAKYDLPAIINFILAKTEAPNLYYVGHSMGTLTGFVQFSADLEFAKKVKKFYALAPVMKLQNIKGAVSLMAKASTQIDWTLWLAGMEEFFPPMALTQYFAQYVCGSNEFVGHFLCGNMLFLIAGPSSRQLNATRLPVYMAHTPAGTSRRTFIHFGQMVKSGRIEGYDFGRGDNMDRYGSPQPPQYDVSRMETPVALYVGTTDWLATQVDVENMKPNLKNVFDFKILNDFNHMDFLWGAKAPFEIYHPIINDILNDFGRMGKKDQGTQS